MWRWELEHFLLDLIDCGRGNVLNGFYVPKEILKFLTYDKTIQQHQKAGVKQFMIHLADSQRNNRFDIITISIIGKERARKSRLSKLLVGSL